MYYLSNRRFNKISSDINRQLFGGFSFVNIRRNPENKQKEHFCSLPSLITPKKENIVSSRIYNMSSSERKAVINNSFSKALGFEDYIDYKKKTKFRFDIKRLIKVELADYYYLSKLDDVILNNINNLLNFKEKPFSITTGIVTSVIADKRKDFLLGNYKTLDEFKSLYLFILNYKDFSFKKDDKKSREEIMRFLYLRTSPDFHDKDYLPFFLNKPKNKEYLFLDEIHYLTDIFKVEAKINDLSEEKFYDLISKLEGSLSAYSIRAIYLMRINPEDHYIKYLRDIDFNE